MTLLPSAIYGSQTCPHSLSCPRGTRGLPRSRPPGAERKALGGRSRLCSDALSTSASPSGSLCGQGCGVRCPNRQKHHGTVEPGGGGWGRTWDKLRSCDSVTHTAREKVVRRRAPAQSRWPGEGRGRMDDQRPSKLRRPRSVFGVGFRERDGCGFLVTLQEERQEMAIRGGRMKGRSEGEAGVGWGRGRGMLSQ